MRLFSTIFVTYILLLTAAPSLSVVLSSINTEQCSEKSCCSSNKKKQNKPTSQQNKGCCKSGICNAFMSCCNGYALASSNGFFPSLTSSNQKFATLTENSNSGFLSDAWHPPKVV